MSIVRAKVVGLAKGLVTGVSARKFPEMNLFALTSLHLLVLTGLL